MLREQFRAASHSFQEDVNESPPYSTLLALLLYLVSVAPILTLTTDFGTRDAYVAAMKGVILSRCPDVRLVDVTHQITPQEVLEGAFVLQGAVAHYPAGTIHLVVVDPGVGTHRRAVALRHGDQRFVGPDNGLFALLLDGAPPDELVVLDRPAFWRTPEPSATFHGRDIFAPVAAHLAAGRALTDVGTPADALEPMHWALPIADEQGVQGWVIHIDRFGNCITNISRSLFEERRAHRRVKCYAGSTVLKDVQTTYGAVAAGEALTLFGSSGFLEIAVNAGNAAKLLGIRKGASVSLIFVDS